MTKRDPLVVPPAKDVQERRTGVCLNMIVKDEAPVMERLLASVQGVVDFFVIVDTGSSDGTPELIQRLAGDLGLPGEIHFRPWVNFGYNRQEALELALAADRGDWLLFIDADEEWVCPKPELFLRLEPGVTYLVEKHHGEIRYTLPTLVDVRQNRWGWRGPVHEYLEHLEGPGRTQRCTEAWILYRLGQGGRSRNVNPRDKFLRDAALLEEALRREPDNARYRFYLAQSYRDAGDRQQALRHYDLRSRMAGWDQESYIAQCEKVRLAILLGTGREWIIPELIKAYRMRPSRAEALWMLAGYCRSRGLHEDAYRVARLGMKIPRTQDWLFVNHAVYQWRLRHEFVLCALAACHFQDAIRELETLRKEASLPPEKREEMQKLLQAAQLAVGEHQILQTLFKR